MKIDLTNNKLQGFIIQFQSLNSETLTAGTKNLISKTLNILRSHYTAYQKSKEELYKTHGATIKGNYLQLPAENQTEDFKKEDSELDNNVTKDIEFSPIDWLRIKLKNDGEERELTGNYNFDELKLFFENYD